MNKKEQAAHLAQVKLALAAKYERLIRSVKSRPKQKTLRRHAESYRRQAADLLRG